MCLYSEKYARLLSKVLHVTPEYLLLESPYKNEIDEKFHSENYGQYIERFFNYIGYRVEHPSHNRYARVITATELLKSKEYLSGLIERIEYGYA